MVLSVYMAH